MFLVCVAVIGAANAVSQSVSGTVLDAKSGEPLRSAPVMAVREGAPPLMRSTRTDAEGGFQIGGLAPGSYRICVQAASSGYVDPCEWNTGPAAVALSAGQSKTALRIALDRASVVSVDVGDALGLLTDAAAMAKGRELTVGVWDRQGLYHPARREAAPPGGIGAKRVRYGMAVPRDVSLTLYVATRGLTLADANGAALSANASQQTFQQASSDPNPRRFEFRVLGLLP